MTSDSIANRIDRLERELVEFVAKHFNHSKIYQCIIEKIYLYGTSPFCSGITMQELSMKYYQERFLSVIHEFYGVIQEYQKALTEFDGISLTVGSIKNDPRIEELCEEIFKELHNIRQHYSAIARARYTKKLEMVKKVLYGSENTQISDSPIYLPDFREE